MAQESADGALIRRVHPMELGGLFANRLEVPSGQQAMVSAAPGEVRLLPAGRHPVPGKRLFGRPPLIVLAPAGEFDLWCGLPGLPAGDGQPVDARFSASLRVQDASRLAGTLLRGRDSLAEVELVAHITAGVAPRLPELVRSYTAGDLCGPTPVAGQVMAELVRQLGPDLAASGLALVGLRSPSFAPARQVAQQIEAIEGLRTRLGQPPKTGESAGAGSALAEEVAQLGLPAAEVQEPTRLVHSLEQQLDSLAGQLLGRLEARLANGTAPELEPALEAAPGRASERWERAAELVRAACAVLLVGTLSLRLALPTVTVDDQAVWQASQVLGAAGTLAAVIAFFYAHRRARRQRRAELTPGQLLDRFGRRNLAAADAWVRQQLAHELGQASDQLGQARQRVYAAGDEQPALALGELLRLIERTRRQVAAPEQGVPAYLNRPELSLEELAAALDGDEQLLIDAARLCDGSQALWQAVLAGLPVPDRVQALESEVAALSDHFGARTRET